MRRTTKLPSEMKMSPPGWIQTASGWTSGVWRAGRLSDVAQPAIVSMKIELDCAHSSRHRTAKNAGTRSPMVYLGYRLGGPQRYSPFLRAGGRWIKPPAGLQPRHG